MAGRIAPRVYAIADTAVLGWSGVPVAVEALAQAGVGWIQVRAKGAAGGELVECLTACLERIRDRPVTLWVNDRVDVAALLPVGGVHVGQDDLPPAAARRILGPDVLIGQSTHRPSEVAASAADPAVDVVAVGPVFTTASKADAQPVVGLDLVRAARSTSAKPLVAIGGIDATNAADVLDAGADSIAMLGALCHGDVADNCARVGAALGGLT